MDLERTRGIGQNGLRYRYWLRQEDSKFSQQAAKGRQLRGVELLQAHACKTRSACRYKNITGNAKQHSYRAWYIMAATDDSRNLTPLLGSNSQQTYRGRINTLLIILSIQPERTDTRIGLFRQGQAIRIGLQSKLGAYIQELELALTTSPI